MATHFYWVHGGFMVLCSIPGLQRQIKPASAFVTWCCFSHNLGDTIWRSSSNFLREGMGEKEGLVSASISLFWSLHQYWWCGLFESCGSSSKILWALGGLDPSTILIFKGNSFQSMLTHPGVLFRVRPMELGLRSFQSCLSPLTLQEPPQRLSYLVVLVSYGCCDK